MNIRIGLTIVLALALGAPAIAAPLATSGTATPRGPITAPNKLPPQLRKCKTTPYKECKRGKAYACVEKMQGAKCVKSCVPDATGGFGPCP